MTLGRADHGWSPIAEQMVLGGIHSFEWYHLKLLAYGCEVIASVAPLTGAGPPAAIAVNDPDCVRSGRIGLRSFSSGGVWRNMQARPVAYKDLAATLREIAIERQPIPGQISPSGGEINGAAINLDTDGLGSLPTRREAQAYSSNENFHKIGELRLTSPVNPLQVSVRGTVILTEPELFIQDSTGGLSLPFANAPPLKIGDEVEAKGTPAAGDFSVALNHAQVRLLWEREPLLPIAATASQAATGSFAATYIELDGYLRSVERAADNTYVLHLSSQGQSFRAIAKDSGGGRKLRPQSLLRLQGVCVVDPAYTHNLVPFVLLLPSTGDIDVLAGPPWWSTRHLLAIAFALSLLAIVLHFVHSRVERAKLRAIFEERELLAHEMHDTLAQSFAGLGFQLQAIRNRMPANVPDVEQQLDLACNLVRHSHEEARQSIASLRRPEPVDLSFALERCARNLVNGGTVSVEVSQAGDHRPVPVRITDAFFRIGQEALSNAVQHASPTRICVKVSYGETILCLAIEDDGLGFAGGREMKGFGVRGMRKRAAAVSAAFEISSAPGQGTRVLVTAPIPVRRTLNTWRTYISRHLWPHRA